MISRGTLENIWWVLIVLGGIWWLSYYMTGTPAQPCGDPSQSNCVLEYPLG